MDDATLSIFGRLGISLATGMLIGLQREKTDAALAGMRTFALIGLAGALTGLLDQHFASGGWIMAAGLIAVAAVVVISQLRLRQENRDDVGMTTAIAILVVFCLGAYAVNGHLIVTVATGVAVAAVLQFKPELHSIADRLGEHDVRAIIQFAAFSCVILPVLPNEQMGPLNVFNPFNIWLMVVLIVGISLAGYIAYKFFGHSTGIIVGGLLGGAISSTATSVSYARMVRTSPTSVGLSTAVITIASSVVFARVLLELVVVAPSHLSELAMPIVIMLGACLVASVLAWFLFRGQKNELPEPSNPSEFKSAIMFAGLYALVLWGLAATKQYLTGDALYVVAILSGLTDMDAITLSTGRMVEQVSNPLSPETGWRLLVTASISNLLFKSAIVATIGGPKIFRRVLTLFLIPVTCGLLLIFLWN